MLSVQLLTSLFEVLLLGLIPGRRVTTLNDKVPADKLNNILFVADETINQQFRSVSSTMELASGLNAFLTGGWGGTFYVNLTAPSGNVSMDPDKMGTYERNVYETARTITKGSIHSKSDSLVCTYKTSSDFSYERMLGHVAQYFFLQKIFL